MAITNFGSINIDNFYRVPAFPQPGETLLVDEHLRGLGGKGANQSTALAAAGATVRHIGAVGSDGAWTVEMLSQAGVDVSGIETVNLPTGHAVIPVDDAGENYILVHSGANHALTEAQVQTAVSTVASGDWVLLQNETNLTQYIVETARSKGVRICYSAAPFIEELAMPLLSLVDLIVVNELEAAALAAHFGGQEADIPVPGLIVTRGTKGATASLNRVDGNGQETHVPAFKVDAVDTTGAGDTFLGYFLASIDRGEAPATALRQASAAAALQVSRPGAADAIPNVEEVNAFLAEYAA